MEQNKAGIRCYGCGDSADGEDDDDDDDNDDDDGDDDRGPGLSACLLAGHRAECCLSSADFRIETPLIPGKETSPWKRRAF